MHDEAGGAPARIHKSPPEGRNQQKSCEESFFFPLFLFLFWETGGDLAGSGGYGCLGI